MLACHYQAVYTIKLARLRVLKCCMMIGGRGSVLSLEMVRYR